MTRCLPTLLLVTCLPVAAAGEEVLIFDVAAHTVECIGELRQRCLVVRRGDDAPWTNFYQPIEGFVHEEGYAYRLRVARREVENPPADGGAYRYRLLQVLSRRPP